MNTKIVSKEIVRNEWDLPYGGTEDIVIVKNEAIGKSRWTVDYVLVIHDKITNTYWQTTYGSGTGDNGERPWEYEKEVEFTEVEPYEKVIIDYRTKE